MQLHATIFTGRGFWNPKKRYIGMIWAFATSWPKAVWIHTYFLERVSYKGDINHTRLLEMFEYVPKSL